MLKTPFYKYHGTGNDFVLFDPAMSPDACSADFIRRLCDRHMGVGSDGVIFAEARAEAYFMRMFNPDASESEMCGNGIRCLAKHLADGGFVSGDSFPVDTLAGRRVCKVWRDAAGLVSEVEVSMGRPDFERSSCGMSGNGPCLEETLESSEGAFCGSAVSMGNPHFVVFTKLAALKPEAMGAALESHPAFNKRSNIEFVELTGEQTLKVVVYERGAGLTLACGTGATATVAVAQKLNLVRSDAPVRVELPGGTLRLSLNEDSGELLLRGPAVKVFSGELEFQV